ncbi:phosphate ABC transporter permease PstA [Streptomyces polyrhachis]|uniref:Phosphate transport system permease protein PstA n=1 Tax=Streptomyces polyrhachis TaxID=1282885 RepID=A0ABW2GFQ4_9ACTN
MSHGIHVPGPADRADVLGIHAPRLPRWAPAAVAGTSVLAAVVIGLAGHVHNKLQWGLMAAVLYVVGMYALTARVEGRRQAVNRLATSLIWVAFLIAVVPLASLLWETVARGIGVVDGYFLTHSMKGVASISPGGGVYAALIGTLEQVGLATLMAVPLGLLTAIYLVEYGRGKLAKTVTFFVDVMTGIPSIVAGLFVLSLWILTFGFGYSGFAGSIALAILMIPTVVRSTEEMLKLVPNELREAAYALGVPKWKTILKIVLPTCVGGIVTGVMLSVARVTGETAPLLLLIFGNPAINADPFEGAQASLPLYIYEQWAAGNEPSYDRAWGAALVLIAFVMILNLLARGIARWKSPKH